jgi:hypothetical protein
MTIKLEMLDPKLQNIIQEAASTATWRRDYGGGPQGISGGINDAIRKAAAYKIAIKYVTENGVAPKGYHTITMLVGPNGYEADYTNGYIKTPYSTTVEICFNSAKKPIIIENKKEKDNSIIDLGPVDVDLRPGYSFRSHFWIEKISPDNWSISMLTDDLDEEGDPVVEINEDYTLEEAQKYLKSYGINFEP